MTMSSSDEGFENEEKNKTSTEQRDDERKIDDSEIIEQESEQKVDATGGTSTTSSSKHRSRSRKSGIKTDDGNNPSKFAIGDLNHICSFHEMKDDTKSLVENCIARTLHGRRFEAAKVPRLVDEINQECICSLETASCNFKYLVSTILYEKQHGAGLHYRNAVYWDISNDGSVVVEWENDAFGCIVAVFGIAL